MTDAPTDVLVVGDGVLGLSASFELTRRDPGLRVTVVGPQGDPGAASVAAGAMLNCFAEVTKYTLASEPGQLKFEMCRRSLDLWPQWMDEVVAAAGTPRPWAVEGTFVLENAVSGQLDSENFDAILAALKEFGEPHDMVAPASIPGLAPTPQARPLRAVHLPREGAVDSVAFHRCLEAAVTNRGVSYLRQAVTALLREGDRVIGAQLADGTRLRANVVLVAAGAFTTPLLDTVLGPGDVQPVFSGTGIAAITRRAPTSPLFRGVVRTVNRAGSCGLHVVPLDGGRDYLGATNAINAEPQTEGSVGLTHFLLQCAIDQLNNDFAFAALTDWRVGNRPVSLDTFPLIGPGPLDGLVIATATYRDGFHNSPLIAGTVADEILAVASWRDHPFRPTRRPIAVWAVADSAEESAFQASCTAYEGSLVIPRLWRHAVVPGLFAPGIVGMYERLGADHGFSPDIVPFLVAGAYGEDDPEAAAFGRVKAYLAPNLTGVTGGERA